MKIPRWLFIIFLAIGLPVILLTLPLMHGFNYSNGKELLSFYVPMPLTLLFYVTCENLKLSERMRIGLTLLLFLILILPFSSVLLSGYDFYSRDDGYRYRIMANNIANHSTLWGSDDLVYGTHRRVYLVQPGYRYYVAAWIKLFGKENRLFQIFNMLVYLVSVLSILSRIRKYEINALFKKYFPVFIVLSAPFVTKLIMIGLMEWLVITFFIWFVLFYTSRRWIPAIILLALLVFLRQNLLVFSLFVAAFCFLYRPKWGAYLVIYLLVLCLPIFHNLYFAGEWKFFSTYLNNEFFVLEFGGGFLESAIKTFLYHIVLYGGVDWLSDNFFANLISFPCIALGTYLYVYIARGLAGNKRIFYLVITLSAILPTLLLGGKAYYPRFEWVNLFLAFLTFVLFYQESLRGKIYSIETGFEGYNKVLQSKI
ncbi:MAG TPA: hypothetical protein VM012_04165 [Flavitalea sp.]|nr:hypothetical protein [Flavitalea sp.]